MEKQYRPFKSDDIIEKGDQIKGLLSSEWIDFHSEAFGRILNPDLVLQTRKLIKASDETTIIQPKESWTRDEVIEVLKKYGHYLGQRDGQYLPTVAPLDTWILENL